MTKSNKIKFPYGEITKEKDGTLTVHHFKLGYPYKVPTEVAALNWLKKDQDSWLESLTELEQTLYASGMAKKEIQKARAACYAVPGGWPTSERHPTFVALAKAEKVWEKIQIKIERLCAKEAKRLTSKQIHSLGR